MDLDDRKTVILAGFIGNVVEWYDFALYGYLASVFGGLFFPSRSHAASLLATYGVFAAGFIMRPLGAGLFGWFGDLFGRSKTMLISVAMMVIPTFLLGALPTYETVGVWAPVMLIIVRLVQGLSVGGEFSSSVTYLVETAPDGKRGFSGSWANTGSLTGMLVGAAAAAAVTTFLTPDELTSWGWRAPFLFGSVIGAFGIWLRRKLPQSQQFLKYHAERGESSPIIEAWTANRKQTIQAILFASGYGVFFYFSFVYLPNWVYDRTGIAQATALQINTAATAVILPLIPLSGIVGDRYIRRRSFILIATGLIAALSYPLFLWLRDGVVVTLIVVQLGLDVLVAVPLGSAPALFVELFPTRDRLSGYSLAYNLGLGVAGGATPAIATWLMAATGARLAPAVFLAILAGLSTVTLFWMSDGSREALP